MSHEPKYSPETIREYREKEAANGFDQNIVRSEPISLDMDRVTFACGHSADLASDTVLLLERVNKFKSKDKFKSKITCRKCMEEWLAAREDHS